MDEEELDQYELGIKGSFLDGRAQMSLVGYIGAIKDQQVTQTFFLNLPDFINTVSFITNTGKTDLRGIEFEGALLLTDRLTVDATFAWTETEVKKDTCSACLNLGAAADASIGNQRPNVPEYTGSATATYRAPLTGDVDGYLRAEYFYEDSKYATKLNLAESDEAHIVNFHAGVETGSFKLEAYLSNAFNNNTVNQLNLTTDFPTFGNGVGIGLRDRRMWGLRASYRL